jgi:hypothetical protein
MQVLVEGEAQQLARQIREKVRSGESADEETQRRMEAFDEWLRFRFVGPLVRDAAAGPAFGKAATALGVATIGAGLGSSALATASGDSATIGVAVLGIVVGVLGGINQIWRPSQRSVARYQAAFALRREGWDFAQDRGRYERLDPQVRVAAFIDEVTRIHRAVESVDEATSPSQTGG